MGGFILPYPVTSTPLFFASRVSIAVMDFTSVITKIFQTKLRVKWNIALWWNIGLVITFVTCLGKCHYPLFSY